MKSAIIFGAGNIGSALGKRLPEEQVCPKYGVSLEGIFGGSVKVGGTDAWKKFADETDVAFIAIPAAGDGEQAFRYASYFLEKGKPVITCEKAALACHWDYFKKHKRIFKYAASVGGGTRMLKQISRCRPRDIREIKAVVNGTLNYISDNLARGKTEKDVLRGVLIKKYAEPGANSMAEIISSEMRDVILKTVIMANHSGMFPKTVKQDDIETIYPDGDMLKSKRCVVRIVGDKIQAGFLENGEAPWFPDGVNNVLYINGKEVCRGPGAGVEATVSSIMEDLREVM